MSIPAVYIIEVAPKCGGIPTMFGPFAGTRAEVQAMADAIELDGWKVPKVHYLYAVPEGFTPARWITEAQR